MVTEPPGRVIEWLGSPLETVTVRALLDVTVNPDAEFGMYSLTLPLDTTAGEPGAPATGPFGGLPPWVGVGGFVVATGPLGGLPPWVITNPPVVGGFVVATGPFGGLPPWITLPLAPVPATLPLHLSFLLLSLDCTACR